jgi:hypothetical protein
MDDPKLKYVKDESGGYNIVLDGFNERYAGYATIMAKYFDIPYVHSSMIFEDKETYDQTDISKVTRQDVAKCIRDYVERHRDNPDIHYGYLFSEF